jgi:hypothetical protein
VDLPAVVGDLGLASSGGLGDICLMVVVGLGVVDLGVVVLDDLAVDVVGWAGSERYTGDFQRFEYRG